MASVASPAAGRQEVSMVVGFLTSYVLRATSGALEAWLRKSCHLCICGRGHGSAAVLASERSLTWLEAKARLDATEDLPLLALAGLRLVFWHWLQPVAFALLLYSWSDDVYFGSDSSSPGGSGRLQAVLACAVLVREILYFVCSVLAAAKRPAFLLIDVAATWRSGAKGEAIASVLMPEKFLGWYLLGAAPSAGASRRFNLYCMSVLILDGCSLLALWAGLAGWTAQPPLPLAICYSVTTVSLLAMPCWAFILLALGWAGIHPDFGFGRRVHGLSGQAAPLDIPLEPTSD
ncbi:unnamed protein product [Polarella glacialis]|uniref:Uncharacterized protein n=1 Tax=Polarella glacialis TaxID=89957 RepID=A0A813DNA4_POLGL|nr:unnamed protein product [Polarella glacialis]